MGKIVILDENTSNKIAAGEVIEKPASVIKELIENSIDAGATSISVEIKNGGITYIKVTDNGSGIDEDDAEIAFERHATSKIRNADDLDSISTMGFRGEALASIAAVSTVELTTRVQKNAHGTYIRIQGGNVKEVKQTGCPVGTTFLIKDLFYNTPARFKFLKKDSTEAGYVSDSITRIALGNPNISFRLISNGSTVLHTPGNNDLLSTIFSIYGKETAREVSEINYSDHRLKITGYAGKPEIARSNRNQQSIFINRRYIKSKIITSAIDESYKTLIMKNKYPFVIMNLEINPTLVDVNVHPAKMEVRFSEEQEIFRSVYHAVNNAFMGKPLYANVQMRDSEKDVFKFKNIQSKPAFEQQSLHTSKVLPSETKRTEVIAKEDFKTVYDFGFNSPVKTSPERGIQRKPDEQIPREVKTVPVLFDKDPTVGTSSVIMERAPEKAPEQPETIREKNLEQHKQVQEKPVTENPDGILESAFKMKETSASMMTPSENEIEQEHFLEDARLIGQAFSTYIILQQGNELVLVDQHAAHERIMFERLKRKFDKKEAFSQVLLAPVVIELTFQEIKLLEDRKDFFNSLGFSYENFGNNSIILREVPELSEHNAIKEIFLGVLDHVLNAGKNDYSLIADEAIYTMACKAAVKANMRLDDHEIAEVLKEMSKLENPYTCPHGRPTMIRMTKYELEKMFKRKV